MKRTNRYIFLSVILTLAIVTFIFIQKQRKKPSFDFEFVLNQYQLPSHLYAERIEIGTESNLLSTALMCRIYDILHYSSKVNVEYLNSSLEKKQLNDIYIAFLMDSVLSNANRSEFIALCGSLLKNNGYLSSNDDLETDCLFTAYALTVLQKERVSVDWANKLKVTVEDGINSITISDTPLYAWSLMQIANTMGFHYDKKIVESYLNDKLLDVTRDYNESHAIDSISLYYISYGFSILEKEIIISEEVFDGLLWLVTQNYYSLPDLKNAIYVIEHSKFSNEAKPYIDQALTELNKRFGLGNNTFTLISDIMPSFQAIYCGNMLRKQYNSKEFESDSKVALAYVEDHFRRGVYREYPLEEVYYMCAIAYDFGLKNELLDNKEELFDYILGMLQNRDVNSIRNLYCGCMTSKMLEGNEKLREAILLDLHKTIADSSYTNNLANICMINECFSILNDGTRIAFPDRIKFTTLADVFHYVHYLKTEKIKINRQIKEDVRDYLKQVQNDNGYYFSESVKTNSLYPLYLGFMTNSIIEGE